MVAPDDTEDTMTDLDRWTAVINRDAGLDGRFVFAVRTTGVYCRPSCAARRPRRENVSFYDIPAAAERDGFRACRRCRPERRDMVDPMMAAVEDATRRIDRALEREGGVPGLEELAGHAGFNAQHFQKAFKRALGVSPKQYAEARRVARLKAGLRSGNGVADAVYAAGYGAPSRVYEQAGRTLGMAPGVYARGAPGVVMAYAFADSRLGVVMAAATGKGVSAVYLGDDPDRLARELELEYPGAVLHEDRAMLGDALSGLVRYIDSRGPSPSLPLDVRATAFQWRVWQALLEIPYGETRSYAQVAQAIGQPTAARAVGRACGVNPVSLVIPCHRALGADGRLHGYRWGVERKQALLDMEQAGPAAAGGD